ncbi:MAG: hypothetical protein ACYC35_06630 [Pirellulales bacterium]
MTNTAAQYPWYETVEGDSLGQGDLLPGFEVYLPIPTGQDDSNAIPAESRTYDLLIMTQTCDIEHHKVRSLLLCPWWNLWDFIDAQKDQGQNWSTDIRESLRRGALPGYHLLNDASQDGLQVPLLVVDFHEVYTAPADIVRAFASKIGKRLRLCPPYREHLAQAFARFFMRVGLPVDISREKIKNRPPG